MIKENVKKLFGKSIEVWQKENPNGDTSFLNKYKEEIELFLDKTGYLIDDSSEFYLASDSLELKFSYKDQSLAIKLYFDIFRKSHELFFTVLSAEVYNIASLEIEEIKDYFKES